MNTFKLPISLIVRGREMKIRTDFRDILKVCLALNDVELTSQEKAYILLKIIYIDSGEIADIQGALEQALQFINIGKKIDAEEYKPILMNWEKDFTIIAPAVDKVVGFSCRRCEYMHWWEFIGAYNEIGESLFSTIVSIRKKQKEGKKLENYEKEFVKNNRDLISLPQNITQEEQDFISELLG